MKNLLIITGILIIVVIAGLALLPASPLTRWPLGDSTPVIESGDIRLETVAESLEVPWSIGFINDDIIFSERSGAVRLIKGGALLNKSLATFPAAASEGGTLGVAVDPNFAASRYIFVYYTATENTNRLSRFRLVDDQLREEQVLIANIPASPIHNGGRLAFGPDSKLYVGTGDANQPELAQDRTSLAGKILRLNPDGTVPLDNPFGADSYVYSLGHRNVQGLAWDQSGQLHATEHGSQALDEVNKIEAGLNYGWPDYRGQVLTPTSHPGLPDYRDPLVDSGTSTWAPSGAAFYSGDALPASWQGKLYFAGLRSQTLWRLDTESRKLERLLSEEYGRLRDVSVGPDGYLYILTSNRDGRGSPEAADDRILRIMPAE